MATHLFAILASEDSSVLIRLLGRFHPAIVHFPIALLTVAAVLESWQLVRRKPGLAAGTPACLLLGSISAVAASVLGFFFDEGGGKLVDLHKWVGIASTVIALLAVSLLLKADVSPKALTGLRGLLFTGAALVGLTGYLGGELVFGENHIFKGLGLFGEKKTQVATVDDSAQPDEKLAAAHDKISFAKDIAPILNEYCFECHGGQKTKGKFDLKTKIGAMKGGSSGQCIVPGKADDSLFYTRLVDEDAAVRMPPAKYKQMSPEQIATLRKWIDQGADWPDEVALK